MPADKPTTRIVSNPRILGGSPVVEGTRVPAGNVLAELASGADRMAVFRSYPSLPLDGIEACVAWDAAGRPVIDVDPVVTGGDLERMAKENLAEMRLFRAEIGMMKVVVEAMNESMRRLVRRMDEKSVSDNDSSPSPAMVVCDPEVMSGQPCFAGTRIPVESVAINLKAGYSIRRIEAAYPTLPHGWRGAAEAWNVTMKELGSPDCGEGNPMDQVMERLSKRLDIGLDQMDGGEFSERSVAEIAAAVMAKGDVEEAIREDMAVGSGHVFADSGLPDAEERPKMVDFASRLQSLAEEKGLVDFGEAAEREMISVGDFSDPAFDAAAAHAARMAGLTEADIADMLGRKAIPASEITDAEMSLIDAATVEAESPYVLDDIPDDAGRERRVQTLLRTVAITRHEGMKTPESDDPQGGASPERRTPAGAERRAISTPTRADAVRSAIANTEIGGGLLSPTTVALLNAWARGEMTDDELLERAMKPFGPTGVGE